MIIKDLSRKNANGRSQLIKYIFRYIFRDDKTVSRQNEFKYPFFKAPDGVFLARSDIHFLQMEWFDGRIIADFKEKYPEFNYKAYIENYLLNENYWFENIKRIHEPFIIRHNMPGNTIKQFVEAFEKNEDGRIHTRSDQTAIHHTIISFGDNDREKITTGMLQDIAHEYIRLRGENNIYCGTLHTDRSHIHLHIAMSATTLEGKSSRISKEQFEKEVKIKLQEYQMRKYPELSHSIVQHGKQKDRVYDKERYTQKIKTERALGKQSLLRYMETTYHKALSPDHFFSMLQDAHYKVYYRNDKPTGILTEDGFKYRFTRLNVDIGQLFARHKEDTQLKELQALRKGIEREERHTDPLKEKDMDGGTASDEDRLLQELADLRDSHDRDFDREIDDYDTDDRGDADDPGDAQNEEDDSDTENETTENDDEQDDTIE